MSTRRRLERAEHLSGLGSPDDRRASAQRVQQTLDWLRTRTWPEGWPTFVRHEAAVALHCALFGGFPLTGSAEAFLEAHEKTDDDYTFGEVVNGCAVRDMLPRFAGDAERAVAGELFAEIEAIQREASAGGETWPRGL